MEISAPKIDGEICKISSNEYTLDGGSNAGNKCGLGHSGSGGGQLKSFRTNILEKGKGWPGSGKSSEPGDDNARQVADDLTKKLGRDEKTIVAGLLAKTIEGGEVVERCLSTST
ncbi:hypothetical protein P029_03915 [Anaplasma phagocytophilum str. Norway variant2]|uniref:Uncharacterized protein n=1 Tax=Anaplasma phagocytophilum str. Norway variant2 TaxID=1392507 RepID=A0A168HF72_ANAPH|nr:hypothetical protein [Anaplasma phagocytophilum]ANC34477.1 hypothetical protein P029_03915 [Anaplasma phagocytophilum str. Norway variant2]